MGYVVTIKCEETGELRKCHFDTEWTGGGFYAWSAGNYSCDCNRALFYDRAGGNDDPDMDCGSEAFSVIQIKTDDGVVVCDNDPDPDRR